MLHKESPVSKTVIIKFFKLEEKASCPDAVVAEILAWTNSHPILTQKICQSVYQADEFIQSGEEAAKVKQLVRSQLIDHWETQSASEHLQLMQNRILNNQQCDPFLLLQLYKKILQKGEIISKDSADEAELLNLGLIVQQEGKLKVANQVYQSVFDGNWVEKRLANRLQPTPEEPYIAQKSVATPNRVPTSEHLQLMQNRILQNQQCDPFLLLQLYKKILQKGEITSDDSAAQAELLNLGLIVQQDGKLKVANQVYRSVFDSIWVEKQLANLPQPTRVTPQPARATPQPALELPHVAQRISNPNPSQPNPVVSVATTPNARNATPAKKPFLFRYGWVFLGVAGLLVVGFSLFKWLQVETIFKRANERLNQKEYQQAIDEYNALLNFDSNYFQAWTNRGYALAGLKEYSKMLESCTTATIIQPKSLYAWNCQGEALHNLKRYDEAIATFDKAIALNQQDPIFWINKAESQIALKQTDSAVTTINQAIELLGQVQAANGKEGIAREASIAWSHKGKALTQKQEYEAALKSYEQSLTYDPNYFAALRGKGIALQGLQRYNDAIAQFQQLLDRSDITNEQKAEAGYYLGLTFCQSNESEKAIAAFDQALTLQPNYEAAAAAKKRCLK